MPHIRVEAAKRALITALKSLARAYGVPVALTRYADDAAVRAAHRRVVLRVHPDKGGSVADAQRLSAAAATERAGAPEKARTPTERGAPRGERTRGNRRRENPRKENRKQTGTLRAPVQKREPKEDEGERGRAP